MDGSAAYRLVSEDVKWPNGISVDSQWIYWTDAYLDCIERITFSGQQRSVILDSLPHPYAIAVFKNEIYWDDWSQLSIFRASKHSRSQVEILASQLTGLMDMKVFYKGKNAGSNACVPQPCSLLCLPKANNSKSCRCPEGVASSVLPSGDLMCDCPQGYQRKNNTCVKEENTCLRNQYRCSNGNCINSIWWCDFDNDCGDMSDERNCPTTVCDADTQFRCQESGTCIPLSYKCDLEDDCGDNSDESHCEMHQCRSDEFNCSSGMCIRSSWVCDGDNAVGTGLMKPTVLPSIIPVRPPTSSATMATASPSDGHVTVMRIARMALTKIPSAVRKSAMDSTAQTARASRPASIVMG